jgi:hypothetical protein
MKTFLLGIVFGLTMLMLASWYNPYIMFGMICLGDVFLPGHRCI